MGLVGLVGLYAGDGLAGLIGLRFGKAKLPHSKDKVRGHARRGERRGCGVG